MKFVIGFLVAFVVVVGSVGAAVAQCSCNQDPTVLDGGWGNTPPECRLVGGCSVDTEWQRTINQNRINKFRESFPSHFVNPAAREAWVILYGFDLHLPVLHEEWYDHNPSYSSKWYRNSDGTLPSMTLWDSLSIQDKYGW